MATLCKSCGHPLIFDPSRQKMFCEQCGNLMGTPESVRHAVGPEGDVPTVCDTCRKKQLANEMMQTYRYV